MKDHPAYAWLLYLILSCAAFIAWNGTGENDEE